MPETMIQTLCKMTYVCENRGDKRVRNFTEEEFQKLKDYGFAASWKVIEKIPDSPAPKAPTEVAMALAEKKAAQAPAQSAKDDNEKEIRTKE